MNFKIWSEAWEQQQVCTWLDIRWYKYTAIINDMRTNSIRQKLKATAIWLKPWMSDMIIVLKRNALLFLEMKKAKWKRWWLNWSKISTFQLERQENINKIDNCQYIIWHGHIEAIKNIINIENDISPTKENKS